MGARRVARGIALLDAREPGWDRYVSSAELDLGSSNNCVLAQIGRHHYGMRAVSRRYRSQVPRSPYSLMVDRLGGGLGLIWGVRHGFLGPRPLWVAEINRRHTERQKAHHVRLARVLENESNKDHRDWALVPA